MTVVMLAFLSCEPIDDIDKIEVLQERKVIESEEPGEKPEEVVKTLTASPTTFDVDAAGGIIIIKLKSNCDWTVGSSVTWCHSTVTTGNGDYSLEVIVDENTSETSRNAILTIMYDSKKVEITVTQKGKEKTQRDPSGDDNTPPSW